MRLKKGKIDGIWIAALVLAMQSCVYGNYVFAAQPSEQITVTSDVMFGEHGEYVPEEFYEEGGCTYRLKSWEMEAVTVGPRQREVSEEVLYHAVESTETIPEYCSVTARDETTGQQITAKYPVLDMKNQGEEWQDDFSFPVVFHSYGADFYQLGSRKVPLDVEKPALDGCEDELLEEIHVSKERYRIRGITWDGPPYYDENGILCRNALAQGSKMVTSCLVTYGGPVTFPEAEGVRCRAVYQRMETVGQPAEDAEIVPETGQFQAASEVEASWLITKQAVVITISLLFITVFLLFSGWLINKVLKDRRGEKRKERGICYEIKEIEKIQTEGRSHTGNLPDTCDGSGKFDDNSGTEYGLDQAGR